MKCPNCGTDIREDLLICEVCGTEIQVVPDFEPEIEKSITESLPRLDLQEEYITDPESLYYRYGQPYTGYYYTEDGSAFDMKLYYENGALFEGDLVYGDGTPYGAPLFYEDGLPYEGGLYYENGDPVGGSEAVAPAAQKEPAESAAPVDQNVQAQDDPYEEEDDDLYFTDVLGSAETNGLSEEIGDTNPISQKKNLSQEVETAVYAHEEDEEEELDDFDEEYFGDDYDDFEEYDVAFDEDFSINQAIKAFKNSKFKSLYLLVLIVILVFILMVVSWISRLIYQKTSPNYQVELAQASAANGDYESAIEYINKAISLDNGNSTYKFDLCDYYLANQEEDKAILTLWDIIYAKDSNSQKAYERLINYYAQRDDFYTIQIILGNCNDELILANFQEYLANPPEFSVDAGVYDDVVALTLSSVTNGTIYYTLDGMDPTLNSTVYTTPIYLEMGIHEVKALFENNYGITSSVVSKMYTIDIDVPDAPEIYLESGDYTSPEMIEVGVAAHTTVYYTTDGTLPDNNSTEYTCPIPMPVGKSHFIFVAYNEDNYPGEFSEADYNLALNSDIIVQEEIDNIKRYNLAVGRTTNEQGSVSGSSNSRYTYIVNSAITLNSNVYYILTENLVDSDGNSMRTGTYYLADIRTGSLYKASRDDDGIFSRGDLVNPELYALPEPTPTPVVNTVTSVVTPGVD